MIFLFLAAIQFAANAAHPKFCDYIATGAAAKHFENQIDPSVGHAWLMQGEVLKEFQIFHFEKSSYLAIRKLGQGAEGVAYLAFDESFQLVVIKDANMEKVNAFNDLMERKPQTASEYIAEIKIKTDFLTKKGIVVLPILEARAENSRALFVKPYIPGILVSDIDKTSPLSKAMNEQIDHFYDQLANIMTSDEYLELVDQAGIAPGLDASSGNWIYFNNEVFLIDF